jgi:two-component system KDP operon response regulator KdpE
MNNGEILVIDDEAPIRKLLEITLHSNDYKVKEATSAKEGLLTAAGHSPDLIILDLGLPDEDGHSVLKKLRGWYTKPIIILSVQSAEEDIVKALDNGANDYLIKPFRTGELLARIRSALRAPQNEQADIIIEGEGLAIDLALRIVRKNQELIKLTATEFSMLALFARNEGKVLTHQYVLKQIWGPGSIDETQYLRVYIAQLRKKIETDPNRPVHLITESGVGYRFVSKQ